MTPADHPNAFRAQIEELRGHAHQDPTLLALKAALAEYRYDASNAPGLYFDRAPAAGIRIGNEYRVSVARIWSVTDAGCQMVGQCHVTATTTPKGRTWVVRWYVHAPDQFWSSAFDDVHVWWLQVLERHLVRGGSLPEMVQHVTV